jgi:replicative superfamily II helicase
MNKPITIQAEKKESIAMASRRAMKNADANNRIVSLVFDGGETLVYPNDQPNKVMKAVKIQQLVGKLKNLSAKVKMEMAAV